MNRSELVEEWKAKIRCKEDFEKNKLELHNDLMIYAVENSPYMELVKVVRLNEEVK